jgi:hypothetical protein
MYLSYSLSLSLRNLVRGDNEQMNLALVGREYELRNLQNILERSVGRLPTQEIELSHRLSAR